MSQAENLPFLWKFIKARRVNKHVKLLQMLWNSRREGHQHENEEYQGLAMLGKGNAELECSSFLLVD